MCLVLQTGVSVKPVSAIVSLGPRLSCGGGEKRAWYTLFIHTDSFEVKNNITLTATVCIASFEVIGNFQRKYCITHVLQHLAGMDKHVDNSCKQRADYLHHSLVIVYTECGQWQVSFLREKLVSLAEVSVTYGNFQIPRNPEGTEHVQTVCIRHFFLLPCTRA